MTKQERQFVKRVWQYWSEEGRHDLPWRKTTDPYRILVSEIMLQQTQVSRVLPKYQAFIKAFPTAKALAEAPLAAVLRAWQGLGYNRRARLLKQAAVHVTGELGGIFPDTTETLQALPGVGPYTAGAVMAFAYNRSVSIIETNIRTVYLQHFFKDKTDVSERELFELIERTSDKERPREWYWALMDYGAHLKAVHGNPNSRAKSYQRQSKFEGSDRQIRGAIIRALTKEPLTRKRLHTQLAAFSDDRIDAQLERLFEEGMIEKYTLKYRLPE